MPKSNQKTHAKRKRELAKLDKRHAKDQKRAARKAERVDVATLHDSSTAPPGSTRAETVSTRASAAPTPLTLADLAERWKSTRIAKPKVRGQ